MSKLRIAVWHNLPSGGGKRQLYHHVKGLIERGHHVESWCPDTADQKFLPLSDLVPEHVVPLNGIKRGHHSIVKSFREVRELIEILEEHCRISARQINSGGFDVLFANACMFFRTSAIASHVTLPSALYLGEPYRWFYEAMPKLAWIALYGYRKFSLRSLKELLFSMPTVSAIRWQAIAELHYARAFDRILVNSIYSRETVLRVYNLESTVCYLGIDTEQYRPTGEPKETFVVGLGSIYHGKGVDRAIRAVGAIPKPKRPALVWIGNGANKGDLIEYQGLAAELQVELVTKLNISDKDVISLLSRAAAMVYTSRLEPFGLAPLEANACGTAVVGIAEGGVKETIVDGVNGFLVNEDDAEMIGGALEKLIASPEFARNLGLKAREYVIANWNLSKATDAIESKLGDLLNSGDRVHKGRV
jgi:glycosyltransferase involved in cell wall biosynthesis